MLLNGWLQEGPDLEGTVTGENNKIKWLACSPISWGQQVIFVGFAP